MTTTPAADRTQRNELEPSIKRRGLLAAAWAAVAAVVLKQTTQPVEAGVDGDVVLGVANSTPSITEISNASADSIGFGAFCQGGTNGWGLFGQGSRYGVLGENTGAGGVGGAGVFGIGHRSDGYGVAGQNALPNGTAVLGQSLGGNGVLGQIPSGSLSNAIAVYGANLSTYAGPGPGAGGFGVYGLSARGHGLVGAVASAGAAAVVGATNGVAGAYAGAFYGPVVVSGAFTVFGAKSAAVPHPDESHRRLYCVENPESWFEDFGKGQLECGRADVTIDPDFAAVVQLTDYHVFLTEYGGHSDLTVAEQTPTEFRVEARDPTSATRFSWRIVAKRKDIAAPRFESVSVPPEPVLPPIADPVGAPETLQVPDIGQLRNRVRR
jgi:hypothetical protein